MIKIGLGYDLHKLAFGRKLVIGGVEVPSDFGSIAHSDGDILIHALVDALLSPLGAGDIGALYPDTSSANKDISSITILKEVKSKYLQDARIINIDAVIILDKPKILPFIEQMKQTLASVLEIDKSQIGIKGKTSENTRIYSVECHCVCLIEVSAKQ